MHESNDWINKDGKKLEKVFTFKDFKGALEFINKVGEIAEAAGHHPDIHLFDYKHVRLELTTHDAGGLTEKDHTLAAKIDELNSQ